jgi:hypothetical protein
MEMQLKNKYGYEFTIKRKGDRWWYGPASYSDYEVESYIENGTWQKSK